MDLVGLLCTIAELEGDAGGPLQLLRQAVDAVLRHTGWPIGSIWLIGPAGTLTPVDAGPADATSTFNATALQHGAGRGLPGRVTVSGRPAWIADVHDDTDFPRLAAASAAGLHAAVALPILAGAEVAAVLEFFAHEAVEPDARLLQVMAAIGVGLGRAFERDAALPDAEGAAVGARQVLEAALDAFVAVDGAGVVTGWNTQAEIIFGWGRAEAIGRPVSGLIIPGPYRDAHVAELCRSRGTGQPAVVGKRIELEGMRRTGEVFPLEISFWATRAGNEWGFYSFCRDITDRKIHEAELARRSLHDDLTGLANRSVAIDRINQALARRARNGHEVAVLFLDLDQFKVVNDSLGHHVGDELLQAVARRIGSAVRPADTVARIAGDEFAIICDDLSTPADADRLANRILRALASPVDLAEDRIRVGASIGIALAGSDSGSAEDLLRDADVAMYWAKQHGRGQFAVFDQAMRGRLYNRLRTEQELAEAITDRQLRLHYQPVVDLANGRITGVEALVRWQHPLRGLLLPAEFIPLAEETGLIIPIGTWVLREAFQQARQWQQLGCPNLTIAVNFSARQLAQSGFIDTVAEMIAAANLDPDRVRLDFEVTENLLMHDPEATAGTLTALRRLGVGVSIDDFGTGYSSLAYLKRFPVDTVKIDRSFISGIDTEPHDLAIVDAIVTLGHALGLGVIAEGVESETQRRRLVDSGCDLAQGFLFGTPVPADHITRRLTPASGSKSRER